MAELDEFCRTPDGTPDEYERLLADVREDVPGALDRLAKVVFPALRQIAASLLRKERDWHTLRPTDLVHVIFMRLFLEQRIDWRNADHFFFVVAREMRQVLVAHARRRVALKRGGKKEQVSLDGLMAHSLSEDRLLAVIAVDLALREMANHDERAVRIVELRFYFGLDMDEIAEILATPIETVRAEWMFARAWLSQRLRR